MNRRQLRSFRSHLREIERRVARTLKDQTTCCGVTSAQFHVLMELAERRRPSIMELAAALQLDASTLSRTVDGLVKAGLLEREENPTNRRSNLLSLTSAGKQTCDEINRTCDEFYARLLAKVPAEKHETLLEAVRVLASVFGELPAAGPELDPS
ncbi:MAG TPA: MarR family transcriptional regulator [Candidatus Aminicenantes bacterium]|nr:MarR family transcriptional regulator [Candidatus Aminicenantes bacterium]